MLLRDASFVVVDVETTGLNAVNGRITEIAMVRFERSPSHGESWGMVDSFTTLINPEQFISPFITRHTGITNAMVYGKPKFGEIVPEIKRFLGKSDAFVLTGHNVGFDYGFLARSFERHNETLAISTAAGLDYLLCTCKLARRMLPKLRSRSLVNVQAYFGIKNPAKHRAMGDAEATAKVLGHFLAMAEEMGIESLAELLRFQNAKSNYVRRKTKRERSLREHVKLFPERPGVYTMTSSSGDVLYVGKAKNLRDRVTSYFSDANTQGTKLAQLMRSVKEIAYEETGSELSALLLESRRIKELSPRFNSMERRYK
ncbi:MAG TPA: exonuclease domain-containing protein, partial [Candidatus Kapabacteria bacterium]|nr:exonuclease domain-containing protein [Candidatus Kapabacteria bacterium]